MIFLRGVLMLFYVAAMVILQHNSSSERSDIYCGSRCLYIGLKALEASPKSYNQLQDRIGDPGLGGYSMLQLERVAQGHGLYARSVHTTLENLVARREGLVCLTLSPENHYVVLSNIGKETVTLLDPPRVVEVPTDTFVAKWTRNCLLLSHTQLEEEESVTRRIYYKRLWKLGIATCGMLIAILALLLTLRRRMRFHNRALLLTLCFLPGSSGCAYPPATSEDLGQARKGLYVNTPHLKLGTVQPSDSNPYMYFTLRVHNSSHRSHRITDIKTSCGCTVVTIDSARLDPGRTSTLSGRLQVTNYNETRSTHLRLLTDDPANRELEVVIEWETRSSCYVPGNRIDIANVKVQSPFSATCPLLVRKGHACLLVSGVSASTSRGIMKAEFRPDVHHNHVGNIGDVQCGVVALEVPPQEEPGSYADTITVSMIERGERHKLFVPVTIQVREKYSLGPRRLSLEALNEGGYSRKRVVLTSMDGREFTVSSIASNAHNIKFVSRYETAPSSTHIIDLSFPERSSTDDPLTDVLVFTVDDGEVLDTVSLPISVLHR